MAAYLTGAEASARLSASYGIASAGITDGEALVASHELDRFGGPFIGRRLASEQERAFPRSVDPQGNAVPSGAAVPAEVLDAVALLAYHGKGETGGAITSYSVLDKSVTYAEPQHPKAVRQAAALIAPYQRTTGTRAGRYSEVSEREIFERY